MTVSTRTDVAELLCVPEGALDLVTLSEEICVTKGCNHLAIQGNYRSCAFHGKTWFPRKTDGKNLLAKRRGYILLGPEFQRKFSKSNPNPPTCCCENEACVSIGYSNHGMFRLTSDKLHLAKFLDKLSVSSEKKARIIDKPRDFFVAPWHFFPEHRKRDENGKWAFRTRDVYYDSDRVKYTFPPPNFNPKEFITEVRLEKHGIERKCTVKSSLLSLPVPHWFEKMQSGGGLVQKRESIPFVTPPRANKRIKAERKPSTGTANGSSRRRKGPISKEKSEVEDLKEKLRIMEAQLMSAIEATEGYTATITKKDEELQVMVEKLETMTKEQKEMQKTMHALKSSSRSFFSYEDISPGGRLAKHVDIFMFLPTLEINDLFLEGLNYSEASNPNDGVCQNLVRFSSTSLDDRKRFQEKTYGVSADMDSVDEGAVFDESAGHGGARIGAGRKRNVDWKTEWLMFNCYARCGFRLKEMEAFFDASDTVISDIIYAWANLLDEFFKVFFPTPSRSQMLSAYPESVIRKFGKANIFMLMDATEIQAEIASMKLMNSALFSAYKHNSTLKWLTATDAIGTSWHKGIPPGHPGGASDGVMTVVTKIVNQVPPGMAVEVDKGFLIDNLCALAGVICIRPEKKLGGQVQQAAHSTALTQKIGKTRIPIEQSNGQMKQSTLFFDSPIAILQLGLADLLFRIGYLIQNFKLGFIQERFPKEGEDEKNGRPCRAEIRWHGATDIGLVDVRPFVEMWGTQEEVKRWHDLRNCETNRDMSDVEISNIVLAEDYPAKIRDMLASL